MTPHPSRLHRRLGHGGLSLVVLATSSTLLWSALSGTASADSLGPAPVCTDGTCVVTFARTGDVQTYEVPAGVTSLTATVAGASGGGSWYGPSMSSAGGSTRGTFSVKPGEQLSLVVGGAGTFGSTSGSDGAPGGYGGGGTGGTNLDLSQGGGSGGGGSFLFDETLLLAAGGGGGGGNSPYFGDFGSSGGGAGSPAEAGASVPGVTGGEPGTLEANGAGGAPNGGDGSGEVASPLALPTGGAGGDSNGDGMDPGWYDASAGAGGGGGYHAGGGGGGDLDDSYSFSGSGGGGGAGFAADDVTDVVGQTGVQLGNGQITLTYADARITFSDAPKDTVVGGPSYEVSAQGVGSGAVTLSLDPSTTNSACTLSGSTVSFLHAGTCVIAADQEADGDFLAQHAVQTITVGQASQSITFDPPAATGHVGDTVELKATGGASGLPVVLTSDDTTLCTVSGTTLTLVATGTCTVTAEQAGNADYTAAPPVSHTITVDRVATTTTLGFDEKTPVYGQPVTASVTVKGATTGGTVQLSIDDETVGDPVAVDSNGKASFALPTNLSATGHPVEVVFTPTDADTYAGSSDEQSLPVAQATTKTTVKVRADEASVVVSAVAPGAGTPEGTVVFSYGSTVSASIPLSHGRATLPASIPVDTEVRVVYSGDADFAGSSDSTLRENPVITATVSSEFEKSSAGWYRAPVKVTFTCDEGSAEITGGCPDPVTLSDDGASQGVTRTITADDGGIATASVTGINIDTVKPRVTTYGVTEGARFFASAPDPGCIATDDLSGVLGCAGTRTVKDKKVTYRVQAIDQAGNTAGLTVHATTYNRGIIDATYVDGTYTVSPGHTYTLVAKSSRQPRMLKPTQVPKKPSKNGDRFHATDNHDEWALGYTVPTTLKAGKTYYLGIRTSDKYVIKIHVIA